MGVATHGYVVHALGVDSRTEVGGPAHGGDWPTPVDWGRRV